MRKDTKVIFKRKVNVFYPFITLEGLTGKERLQPKIDSLIGVAQFQFRMDSVSVATIPSDETEEIELTIYNGLPDVEDVPPTKLCAAGLIKVGRNGITLDSGGRVEDILQWPRGITAVHVVLMVPEVEKGQVRTVVFFIKDLKS
jgi:hypothetical protein